METLTKILHFVIESFFHIWPYLAITIPVAVAVNLSGAAKLVSRALGRNPVVSILLATIVGAFSPFCSCGVIPVIASLLIGGVPLGPVMSFWIASPSMDPEIFFLSTSTLGWNLAVWRLASTFVLSLSAGFITHFAFQKGLLGKDILRSSPGTVIQPGKLISMNMTRLFNRVFASTKKVTVQLILNGPKEQAGVNCCISVEEIGVKPQIQAVAPEKECGCSMEKESFRKRLLHETWKASLMVARFMSLAFFINALIEFYVPREFVSSMLSGNGSFSVIIAALVGVPAYTTNMTALPLISGLIALGMNKGAALAFLISGPTTTLPAMFAVWGIVRPKIFLLYVSFALLGAIAFGLLYNFIH